MPRSNTLFLGAALLAALASTPSLAAGDPRTALEEPGDTVLISLKGTGVQIYQCRKANDGAAAAWTFVRPEAELSDGNASVGTHGAGPFWQYRDGSRITAKLVRKADGASVDDIPWLRLAVDAHTGQGVFSPVDVVIRADTKGGALAGPCDAPGAIQAVSYQATYRFIKRQ